MLNRNAPVSSNAPGRARSSRSAWLIVAVLLGLSVVTTACSSGGSSSSSSTSSSSSKNQVDQLLDDGLAAQSAGTNDVARGKFLQVLAIDPTNKIANYDMGVLYQQANDVANARDAYQKALATDPKYAPALFNLAILETATDPAKAEDLYRQLIAVDPTNASGLFNLGLLLKANGKAAEGDTFVQQAISIDPSLASRVPTTAAS